MARILNAVRRYVPRLVLNRPVRVCGYSVLVRSVSGGHGARVPVGAGLNPAPTPPDQRTVAAPPVRGDEVAEWIAMRSGLRERHVAPILGEAGDAVRHLGRRGNPAQLPGLGCSETNALWDVDHPEDRWTPSASSRRPRSASYGSRQEISDDDNLGRAEQAVHWAARFFALGAEVRIRQRDDPSAHTNDSRACAFASSAQEFAWGKRELN